ncbi:MAG: ornithine acetyltransferase [Desulfobacterales bacterium]|nr:ornithine acetyltransferase [Desulfobacterales bacterium]
MSPEERESFCLKILAHRRIKGCVVVMCEGDIGYLEVHTPQQIRKLENLPDANFWRATVPGWWRNKRPVFIPCGDKHSVLLTYQKLKQLHEQDEQNSYLSPDKLFALVDLDLQPGNLTGISPHYADTEELYHQMYTNSHVNKDIICEEHILITGWIHKEAYFLEPDLQNLFDNSNYQLKFCGDSLQLDNIYKKMGQDLAQDADIENNFSQAWNRIKKHLPGNPENQDELATLWTNSFSNATDDMKRKLIECILTVKKAKPYWHGISVSHSYQQSDEKDLRDSLLLQIAEFYANYCQKESVSNQLPYHIPQWIHILWNS